MQLFRAFPDTVEHFVDDDRIYQSLVTGKWLVEDELGYEWEFVPSSETPGAGTWVLTGNLKEEEPEVVEPEVISPEEAERRKAALEEEESVRQYWLAYPAQAAAREEKRRQVEERKLEYARKRRRLQEERRANRAIFVTNLPLDTDIMEIYNIFSPIGMIDESYDSDKPRITMYKDDDGNFKGEALIVFWQSKSVSRAIEMFDGKSFRHGFYFDGDLTVQEADPKYKALDTTKNDEYKPEALKDKPKRGPLSARERQKIKSKHAYMAEKLRQMGTDDEGPDTFSGRDRKNQWERMVVLKGLFDPEKPVEDVKKELRQLCEPFGEITALVVWTGEPRAVATVRFTTTEASFACEEELRDRFYVHGGGVSVQTSSGHENFKMKPVPMSKLADEPVSGPSEEVDNKIDSSDTLKGVDSKVDSKVNSSDTSKEIENEVDNSDTFKELESNVDSTDTSKKVDSKVDSNVDSSDTSKEVDSNVDSKVNSSDASKDADNNLADT